MLDIKALGKRLSATDQRRPPDISDYCRDLFEFDVVAAWRRRQAGPIHKLYIVDLLFNFAQLFLNALLCHILNTKNGYDICAMIDFFWI
jgi:hypothetical protein